MRAPASLLAAAVAAALLAPLAAAAQAPGPPPEPLGLVLADLDGDRIPDRLGQTVTVAGRATTDVGALGLTRATSLASGGRAIWLRELTGPPVRAGDSLVVTGAVGFWNGLAVLDAPRVRRVRADARVPAPLRARGADLEPLEGHPVTVEGVVVANTEVASGGHALSLMLDDQTVVVAFAFGAHPSALDFDGYSPGDRLRVSGLAGQYDRAEPYDASYQVYPRTASDIERGGLSPRAYKWIALGGLGLFALALAWGVLLRAEVRRRVSQLRVSEHRYRALVRSASEAVFLHDIRGVGVEVNAAARRDFRLAPEAPPPSLFDILAPAYHERAHAHLVVLRGRGNARCDLGLASGEGEPPRVFEFESQVLDVGGERRVLSLARDVGARRAWEAELIAARREAEEVARLKSAFLASMSHEIRTPLTAVIGFAEILRDEVDGEARELAEIIERGGVRLLRTLNSVLDLARLDSGAEALRPRPVDIAEHARQSVALVRSLAEEKGLALRFEHEGDGVLALADPGALDRVVTNLVGNAIKFTPAGEVRVRVEASGEHAVLAVSDTGIGIDEAFLPDLFSEFRQESEGEGRSHEGTGLGLAITDRLVSLMGGTVHVDSEKGVGTTFTVRLPRLPHPAAHAATSFPPAAALSPPREAV